MPDLPPQLRSALSASGSGARATNAGEEVVVAGFARPRPDLIDGTGDLTDGGDVSVPSLSRSASREPDRAVVGPCEAGP